MNTNTETRLPETQEQDSLITSFQGYLPDFPFNKNLPNDIALTMKDQKEALDAGQAIQEDSIFSLFDVASSGIDQINEIISAMPFDPAENGFSEVENSPGLFRSNKYPDHYLQRSTQVPEVYLAFIAKDESTNERSAAMPLWITNKTVAMIVLRSIGFIDKIE